MRCFRIFIASVLLLTYSSTAVAQLYPGTKKFRKRSRLNQKRLKNVSRLYRQNGYSNRLEFQGHIGLSFGQETLIGLPKLGGICKLNFNRTPNDPNKPFKGNCFYAGADLSMIVFFAGAFNAGIQTGFKFGPITIDNSISHLSLMSAESDIVADQISYNPKIGAVFGPVWLKFGPSFIMKGDYILRDGFGMNNFPYNAELLFVGKF